MATVNIYDMADTWNDGGTTFTAIKMTVTQSAAASGSLLLDLQHGTSGSETSKFSVTKDGDVYSDDFYGTTFGKSSNTSTRLEIASNDDWEFYSNGNSVIFYDNGVGMSLPSNVYFGFADSTQAKPGYGASTVTDTVLTRKAAANLQLGAADNATSIVAQTLSVQSVASGGATPNIEGEDFTIQGSAGTGSGAGGSIIFQVAPAGSSGTGQNTLVDALTINSDRQILAATSSDAAPAYAFSTATNTGLSARGGVGRLVSAGTGMAEYTSAGEFRLGGTGYFSFANTTSIEPGAASDVRLYRDTAATLALRNGAAAQTFNIYNTYTNATNYERFSLAWVSNAMELTMGKAGTGSNRDARFVLSNALSISNSSATNSIAYIGTASFGLASSVVLRWASGTNAGSGHDISLRRIAASVLQLDDNAGIPAGSSLQLLEQTAPAAGSATSARIFAQDNGSGKTQLMVQFGSGAAQQIAIEP